MIFTNTALTRLLGAIETDSLVVLCGAGLSRASPSELSLAVEVSRSCYDRWNAIEPLDPSLRDDLDALAGYFYDKGPAFFVSEFLKIVPWNDLVGPPNEGHAAVADFLVTRAASAAMTSNFDALIESWAEALRVDLRGALTGQSATEGSVSPLLKFHGCMRLDRPATLWTHRQLDEATIKSRIKSCSDWMTLHLPGKHLLIVGFWTDWGYLNDVLESSFGITRASSVTVVDPKTSAALETAAPGLWSVLNGLSASFEHLMASGADALQELRVEFSRQWLRRYYALGSGMAGGAGVPVSVASPFDTLDGEDMYRIRRDVETTPYDRAARQKVPPANASQAAFFHVRLLNAGAGQAGAWSILGGESVRVVNGAGRDLQTVRAVYREPPSIASPDYCVCAGSIDLGVPGRVISSGAGRSTVRPAPGGGATWLTSDQAEARWNL